MVRLGALLGAILVLGFVSGCQGILGIEQREIDVAVLTADGYDGCEPANGNCEGCTSAWHTCICEGWKRSPEAELRAECAKKAPEEIREAEEEKWAEYLKDAGEADDTPQDDAVPPEAQFCKTADRDACLDCVCGSCPVAAAACDADTGCSAVLSCMLNAQCESPMAPGTECAEVAACAGLFRDHGGPDGKSARLLEAMMLCSDREGCQCGDDPGPPAECSLQNGCVGCKDCYLECRCNGKSDGQCKNMCAPTCSPLNGCSGCADCVAQCLCNDQGDMQACQNTCNPPACSPLGGCECADCNAKCICEGGTVEECTTQCGKDVCTSNDGCANCNTPFEQCMCQGNPATYCTSIHPPVPPCSTIDGCTTCYSNLAICNCQGTEPFWKCMTGSGAAACANDLCEQCDSCPTGCDCNAEDPTLCRKQCVTDDCLQSFGSTCDQCACESCPFEFSGCQEYTDCPELMTCMEETGCVGLDDCYRPHNCRGIIDRMGGLWSTGVARAETLMQCRRDKGCGCGKGPVVGSLFCGTRECFPFVPPPPETILPACCAGPASDTCGYNMDPLFGPGTGCAPINAPGDLCAQCGGTTPTTQPWNGNEYLEGCCRSEDNTCGYSEGVLGLGCALPGFVGVAGPAVFCDIACMLP